ncbi:MAG TPA: ATP-binding protein [Anaerolineae bacterium]|nr:ATP-binding protein [Anaerolineae bacterium]
MRPRRRLLSIIASQQSLIIIGVLFLVGMVAILWEVNQLQTNLIRLTALEQTSNYSQALVEVNRLYSSEVVGRLRGQEGVVMTHNYEEQAGAIPIPATFRIILGERISEIEQGSEIVIYSEYPFPWRERPPLDRFQLQALNVFETSEVTTYYEFEEQNGETVLRYATSSVMQEACVACHNSHPDTPKDDWETGDIRGVQEVRFPLAIVEAEARQGFRGLSVIFGTLLLIGLGTVGLFSWESRRDAATLESRVRQRTFQLKESQELLKNQNEELEQLNRDKDELLAIVAHDLKNPLTTIQLAAYLLRDKEEHFTPELRLAQLERILNSSERLLEIVTRLLSMRQLEMGKIDIKLESVSLAALVDEVVHEFQVQADKKQIRLEVVDVAGVVVEADRLVLGQVLSNLISNAIKYSPRETKVMIRGATAGNRVVIKVLDEGLGMTAEDLEQLFGKFTRLSAKPTGDESSTGLGLYIVKLMVDAMGGTITADSEGQGKGSVFVLTLPRGS